MRGPAWTARARVIWQELGHNKPRSQISIHKPVTNVFDYLQRYTCMQAQRYNYIYISIIFNIHT